MSLTPLDGRNEPSRPKRTTYETVKQGIKQLYPPEDSNTATNIDVVFVPGLGANPEESWKSTRSDFNWASDKHGLPKDYPNARVLLALYESAFHGPLKVDQFLDNIAKGLLHALQSKRGVGYSQMQLLLVEVILIMNVGPIQSAVGFYWT
jgi:hypothetical protein